MTRATDLDSNDAISNDAVHIFVAIADSFQGHTGPPSCVSLLPASQSVLLEAAGRTHEGRVIFKNCKNKPAYFLAHSVYV